MVLTGTCVIRVQEQCTRKHPVPPLKTKSKRHSPRSHFSRLQLEYLSLCTLGSRLRMWDLR